MMKKTPTSTKDSLPNKEMNDLPRLASAVLPLCSQHPGQCGLFPLEKSLDAFAARYRLAEMAEHTLDVCNQVNHLIPTRVLVKGGEITCKMLK